MKNKYYKQLLYSEFTQKLFFKKLENVQTIIRTISGSDCNYLKNLSYLSQKELFQQILKKMKRKKNLNLIQLFRPQNNTLQKKSGKILVVVP